MYDRDVPFGIHGKGQVDPGAGLSGLRDRWWGTCAMGLGFGLLANLCGFGVQAFGAEVVPGVVEQEQGQGDHDPDKGQDFSSRLFGFYVLFVAHAFIGFVDFLGWLDHDGQLVCFGPVCVFVVLELAHQG